MADERKQNEQSSKTESNGKRQTSVGGLDKSFPSVGLLGTLLVVAIILVLLSGWKIVNMEVERSEIERMRSKVESKQRELNKDLKAYKETRELLPQNKQKLNDLENELSAIKGKILARKSDMDSLSAEVESARKDRNNFEAELEELKAQEKAKMKHLSELRTSIKTATDEAKEKQQLRNDLNKEVQSLRGKMSKLKSEKAVLTADVNGLKADVNGLKREKENQKRRLAQMREDESDLVNLSKKFKKIASKIETTQKQADETILGLKSQIDSLKGQSNRLKLVTGDINSSGKDANKAVQSMESATVKLNNVADKAKTIEERALSSYNQIQNTAEALDKLSVKFEDRIKTIEDQTSGPLGKIDQQVQELARKTESVGKSSSSFENTATELKKDADKLSTRINGIQNLRNRFDNQLSSLKEDVSEYKSAVNEIRQNADDFKGIRSDWLDQAQNMEKVPELTEVINKTENRLAGLDEKIVSLEKRMDLFMKTITGIESTLKEQRAQNKE